MNMEPVSPIINRPLINVGALIDIPTGNYILGKHGEYILNGGISNIEALTGLGNNFKSTISHYFMLQAANRINASNVKCGMHTYDTEDNMMLNLEHLNELANNFENIPEMPIYSKDWTIISKPQMSANEWLANLNNLANKKMENKELIREYTCFINQKDKKTLKTLIPNFIEIDSFTEFEDESTDNIDPKNLDNNMLFMQQGLFKTKTVKTLPKLSHMANMYFILTAHMGEDKNIAAGPFAPQPKKKLGYLKQGEKILGISHKLTFLATHFWSLHGSKPLKNPNTNMPEYPDTENDIETDLNIVKMTQTRSKSGSSGYTLELIVSQREGVLPSLTEFHFIKTNNFGLDGNKRSYNLTIYPDVKLSRTTIRNKLKENPKLIRAINITSEILQLKIFKPMYNKYMHSIEDIYKMVDKNGFDWNKILDSRGWWTIDNYNKNLPPYLSTLDILRMAVGVEMPKYFDKFRKD